MAGIVEKIALLKEGLMSSQEKDNVPEWGKNLFGYVIEILEEAGGILTEINSKSVLSDSKIATQNNVINLLANETNRLNNVVKKLKVDVEDLQNYTRCNNYLFMGSMKIRVKIQLIKL